MTVPKYPEPPREVLSEWNEWHPSRMSCDSTMLVIAPRGAGKTTFMLDCARKGRTPRGMIVCPTPELFKTYGEHFPMLFCHQHFDDDFEQQMQYIQDFHQQKAIEIKAAIKEMQYTCDAEETERQALVWEKRFDAICARGQRHGWSRKELAERLKLAQREHAEEDRRLAALRERFYAAEHERMRSEFSWLCIFDDLAYSRAAMHSEQITRAVKNGRHYIMQQFYACQSVRDFKCDNRDQIDFLAFSPLITLSNVKRFMEDFIPAGFQKTKDFVAVLRTFARYGWWLVIERRTSSMDPHDFVFRYRADHTNTPNEFIGSEEFRWVHKVLYDPEKAAQTVSRTEAKANPRDRARPPTKEEEKKERDFVEKEGEKLVRMFAGMGPRRETQGILDSEDARIRRRAVTRKTVRESSDSSRSASVGSDGDDDTRNEPIRDGRAGLSAPAHPSTRYPSSPLVPRGATRGAADTAVAASSLPLRRDAAQLADRTTSPSFASVPTQPAWPSQPAAHAGVNNGETSHWGYPASGRVAPVPEDAGAVAASASLEAEHSRFSTWSQPPPMTAYHTAPVRPAAADPSQWSPPRDGVASAQPSHEPSCARPARPQRHKHTPAFSPPFRPAPPAARHTPTHFVPRSTRATEWGAGPVSVSVYG